MTRPKHEAALWHTSYTSNGVAVAANSFPAADGSGGVEWATGTLDTLGWFNVKDYGATGDGTTNDTAAIQSAIDAAATAKGGTVYFPVGEYLVSGALQDTGARNAQLLLPVVAHTAATAHPTIRFKGALRPGMHPLYTSDPLNTSAYSVIRSNLTGGTGTAAVFSGGNTVTIAGANNLSVIVEDLICMAPDNPTFTFWNLIACQGGGLRDVQISTTGGFSGVLVEPTNTNAYGVKLPAVLFSNYTFTNALSIGSFYTCLLDGELAMHYGLILGNCIVAVEEPQSTYQSVIFDVQITRFQYGIKATGTHYLDILNYCAEHTNSPAWGVTVSDVEDASNQLHGYIRWLNASTDAGTLDHTFTKNGGANVLDEEMGPTWGGVTAAPRILLADGHATPFTFNDMLQMDDGSDFMWSDPT